MAKQSDGNDLALYIYMDVQRKILSLELEPGTVLPDGWFSQNYNASRTPVRTALNSLYDGGYLVKEGTKIRVSRINAHDVMEWMYARVCIETQVITDFLHKGDLFLIEDLAHILRKQEIIISSSPVDLFAFHEQDVAFHEVWYRAMGKLRLWKIFSTNIDYARLKILDYKRVQEYETIVGEHRRIYECVRSRDAGKLSSILTVHIHDHIASLMDDVAKEKDYFV